MIYNRWGEMIFQSPDLNTGWNGLDHGKPAEMGTYVYFATITYNDGKKAIAKGNVTLIR